ncbi:hypothetical protein AB834_06280 [PVC group bacterium (ex Bugula neritina AB1)]|nr:hypothetical protein AB834_06280 [PVC group bacterium (ex Bugula neritina AB1)]
MLKSYLKKEGNHLKKKKRKVFGKKIHRKRRQASVFLIWKILLILATFAPLVYGGYTLYDSVYLSEMFLLRKIRVQGQKRLKQSDIQKILHLPSEQHIFDINMRKMVNRLLAHPYVKKAHMTRTLPDTLDVSLEERMPYLIFLYGGHHYEVDEEGYIMRMMNDYREGEEPLVKGIEYLEEKLVVGQRSSSLKMLKALEVLQTFFLSDVAIFLKIKTVDISNIKQVALITRNNIKIYMGGSDFQKKLKALSVILHKKKASIQTASYVDLRFGGVIVRPRKR